MAKPSMSIVRNKYIKGIIEKMGGRSIYIILTNLPSFFSTDNSAIHFV